MPDLIARTDLPDDRRYSRDRIWVKPAGGLAQPVFRVGLVFPAAAPPGPGGRQAAAYFARLLGQGMLAAGKSFGFVEVESGRIDLVAPFSARLLRTNGALQADPGLVSSDPYGEGWLCEVTRVPQEAFERLFDRDSFHAYLRFEADARRLGLTPSIQATARWEAGDPSARDVRLFLGGRLFAVGRRIFFGRNETFTPQWWPGQSWRVRCQVRQPSLAMIPPDLAHPRMVPRLWEFTVLEDETPLQGEPCWVVKAIEVEGAPAQIYYKLWIAKADFTLRLIEEISAFDPSAKTTAPNGWGAEGYIELRESRELIVDLPLFPEEDLDERRLVGAPEQPSYTQETRFPSATTMEIVCATGPEAGGLTSEQTWERGLPWWKSAKRTVGDVVVMTGELV
jgi:glycine cleavage system H protein